jgi:hypothetical protein
MTGREFYPFSMKVHTTTPEYHFAPLVSIKTA